MKLYCSLCLIAAMYRPHSVLFVNVIFRDDEEAAAAAQKRFRYALFFIFPSPLTNIE